MVCTVCVGGFIMSHAQGGCEPLGERLTDSPRPQLGLLEPRSVIVFREDEGQTDGQIEVEANLGHNSSSLSSPLFFRSHLLWTPCPFIASDQVYCSITRPDRSTCTHTHTHSLTLFHFIITQG